MMRWLRFSVGCDRKSHPQRQNLDLPTGSGKLSSVAGLRIVMHGRMRKPSSLSYIMLRGLGAKSGPCNHDEVLP